MTLILPLLLVSVLVPIIFGHGILWDPPNRSSMWRFGFDTPINYDDNQLFCGGISAQMGEQMKCGLCGDPYEDPVPRSNENGGLYGLGIITRGYRMNETVSVTVNLETEHKGYFQFHLCNLDESLETETCFEDVSFEDGTGKFYVDESRFYEMRIQLPENLKCDHCVLRWHYKTGNNWGVCENGTEALGCGPQEIFRNCADVSIM